MRKGHEKVVIAGGSGFLGKALSSELVRRGYEVVVLTRRPERYQGAGRAVAWDGRNPDPAWAAELENARAVVNLAGRNVNCRQTERNRREILESRVRSVEAIGEALRTVYRVPEVWVQASSLAIYGDAGDRICDEAAFVPTGFPSDVCVAWEGALGHALRPEMRWSVLRIGFVLGREGGALPVLARLARTGLGGRIGDGRQWMSWIHLEDAIRVFVEAIENPAVEGICNVTGLQPVPNVEFMETLREVLGVPLGLPLPATAVRLAAPLIGVDPELALNGRRGLPCRIHGQGFRFRFHELGDALCDLLLPDPAYRRAEPVLETAR